MKNGAVSYVTRNTAPFCYKAFTAIKSIYSLHFNVSFNAKPFAVRKAKSIALFISILR